MKSIIDIYEGLLAGQEETLQAGDALNARMHCLHWAYNCRKKYTNIEKGFDQKERKDIFNKYFRKDLPELKTNFECMMSDPMYQDKSRKIQMGAEYIAAYMLGTECPFVCDPDTVNSHFYKGTPDVHDCIKKRFESMLTPEGLNKFTINIKITNGKIWVQLIYKAVYYSSRQFMDFWMTPWKY